VVPTVELTPLTPQELPWILERSLATAWAHLPPVRQQNSSPQTVAAATHSMLIDSLRQPGSIGLVARDGPNRVGYILITVMPDELTRRPVGLFLDIWVDPAWRGSGLASALTAAGEQHCRSQGLPLVRRWIAAHNQNSLRHAIKDGCQLELHSLIKPL
jgi:ribosomal protein S18 acetylase RimI-like enzyme